LKGLHFAATEKPWFPQEHKAHAKFSGRAKAPRPWRETPRGQRLFVCIAKGGISLFGLRFGLLGEGDLRKKRLAERLIGANY
jgi:hypothetical protein